MSYQTSQIDIKQNMFSYQNNYSFRFSDLNQIDEDPDRSNYFYNFDPLFETLNVLLLKTDDKPLATVEALILEGVWQNKIYSEIASENNYSSNYISNVAAPKLFKKLSKLIEDRITKKNCRSLMTKYFVENLSSDLKSYLLKTQETRAKDNLNSHQRQKKTNHSFLKATIFSACII